MKFSGVVEIVKPPFTDRGVDCCVKFRILVWVEIFGQTFEKDRHFFFPFQSLLGLPFQFAPLTHALRYFDRSIY